MAAESRVDYYRILGVDRTATPMEIKQSYRKLAMKYHPDKNLDDTVAAEKFKEITVAYSVLNDPEKRQMYDAGESDNILMEGVDISEIGNLARVVGAFVTKLGVPVATKISPKILSQAREIYENNINNVEKLNFGKPVHSTVAKQAAKFYKFSANRQETERGILINCVSANASKFKIVFFDETASPLYIEDCITNKSTQTTEADMYFVDFEHCQIKNSMTSHVLREDGLPKPLHLLSALDYSHKFKLRPGDWLFCVYGDNWISQTDYHLQIVLCSENNHVINEIMSYEKILMEKKKWLNNFQGEYAQAKKRFEELSKEMEKQAPQVNLLLNQRDEAYKAFKREAQQPFQNSSKKGFLKYFKK